MTDSPTARPVAPGERLAQMGTVPLVYGFSPALLPKVPATRGRVCH
jgi:hypothetical protein